MNQKCENEQPQESDLPEQLQGPVNYLILLRIVEDTTFFARQKPSNKARLDQIRCCIAVIKALYDLNQHKAELTKVYQELHIDGVKLGARGKMLIKQSKGIKTAIEILESASENWKQAMLTKLQETCNILRAQRRQLNQKLAESSGKKSRYDQKNTKAPFFNEMQRNNDAIDNTQSEEQRGYTNCSSSSSM